MISFCLEDNEVFLNKINTMKRALTKIEYRKITVLVIVFIFTSAIFSDWQHFKDGLLRLS